MKIAACCMTKNEERDIVEWALFHAMTGFDTIVVFENQSTDRTRERLNSLCDVIDIRIFDWPFEYHPGHYNAFAKCVSDFRDEFDWIALFDHDEFFIPISHPNIKSYLHSMDAHASLAINWAIFGSSGYIDYPDVPVTQAFTHRAPLDFGTNRHVKSIIRPREMIGCTNSHTMDMRPGVQTVDAEGNEVDWGAKRGKLASPVGLQQTARFHHYFVRSRAHWHKRMAIPYMAKKRSEQRFEDYDRNEVYDPIVIEKFSDVIDKITDFNRALTPL